MRPRELEIKIMKAGWRRLNVNSATGHRYYYHSDYDNLVEIPFHANRDIKTKTADRILKDAKLK